MRVKKNEWMYKLDHDNDKPSIISILRGRHGYGMAPELETDWCRVCLLFGFFVGLFVGAIVH